MGFEDQEKVDSILKNHVDRLRKLEESEAKKVLRLYKNIRVELRDRLDTIDGDTFTAQRLRGVIAQVETALDRMSKGLVSQMTESALTAARSGVDDTIEEIKLFEEEFTGAVIPINVNALVIATDTSNFLLNKYDASIKSYSAGVRSRLTAGLTNAAIEQVSMDAIVRRLGKWFAGEEWRLLRIARTEIHNIYNTGKLNSLGSIKEEAIPNLKKTLYHPMDSRTADDSKFADSLNLVTEVDKPFVYKWKRKKADGSVVSEERRFMAPPDRPNDRSVLIPFRKDWLT